MKKLLLVMISFVCVLTACGKVKSIRDKMFDTDKYNTSIVYTIQEENPEKEQIYDLIAKLNRRVEVYTTESEVLINGDNEIVINMLTSVDPAEIIDEIIRPAEIEFIDEEAYENKENGMEYEVLLDGNALESITTSMSENDLFIDITLTESAAIEFEEITKENIGKIIYVIYDGEILLSPIVSTVISGGKLQVSGLDSYEEAESIARNLRIGKLPLTLKLKKVLQDSYEK